MTIHKFIGNAYRLHRDAVHNPLSVDYGSFIRHNREQFLALPINVIFTRNNPYKTSKEMFQAIRNTETLFVFTGGTLPEGHPMSNRDYGIYGNPLANWVFRAVHDYNHFLHQLSFNTVSELKLSALVQRTLPEDAIVPHLLETVFQTCGYQVTRDYVEQKVFRVPPVFMYHWTEIIVPRLLAAEFDVYPVKD
jgi:hypothetical protein